MTDRTTDQSRAAFEAAIAAVLRANGLVGAPETPEQAEEGIHSWRCGYPGVYGPEVCTCFSELVEELADLFGDAQADAARVAGLEADRQILNELTALADVWNEFSERPDRADTLTYRAASDWLLHIMAGNSSADPYRRGTDDGEDV